MAVASVLVRITFLRNELGCGFDNFGNNEYIRMSSYVQIQCGPAAEAAVCRR